MLPEQYYGLATGIGSLPHTSPDRAIDLVVNCFGRIPHWPQLPQRNRAEGLVTVFLGILVKKGIVTLGEHQAAFCTDQPQWEQNLLELYELLLGDFSGGDGAESNFAFPAASAAGFYEFLRRVPGLSGEVLGLKGQVCGPLSAGFQITDTQGRPSFYSDTLREITSHVLARQAGWQTRALKALGLPVMVFIDDPVISNYGSSITVGLGREEIRDSLKIVIDQIRSAGGFTGLHCCAGIDWSLVTDLDLDVLSFDAYDYLSPMLVYSEQLGLFLDRGGVLAWGIVPTSDAAWQEESYSLVERLQRGMDALVKRGVNGNRLSRQFMITPSCGTGTLTLELAERIYNMTAELTARLKQR